jgi:hypothetical protein
MIYINEGNIFKYHDSFCTRKQIVNDTGYLPLRTYNDTLLLSDGRLYKISFDNKLLALDLGQENDYVVISADFTDTFAKINSPGEYYEISGRWLSKIPVIANNSHNIKKKIFIFNDNYYYYYVNVNNELVVFDALHKSEQNKILDNDVSLILYHNYQSDNHCIIYMKNNIIIYSRISNFMQLTNHYVIDYDCQPIIKSSGDFLLDSDNDLYRLISDGTKFSLTKISDNVIDFFCDTSCVYITDTKSKIYRIDKSNYRKYIDVGHFGKPLLSRTKSANNTYKQM